MRILLILFSCLLNFPVGAQQSCKVLVVDDETGDPLPYAKIYTDMGRSVLANKDGWFTVETAEDDIIHVSYVGYEVKTVKAKDLGREIRLKPLSTILGEVQVLSTEHILLKLISRLNKENSKNEYAKSHYFMRMTTLDSLGDNVVVEMFVRAHSTINLNHLVFIDGQCFSQDSKEKNKKSTPTLAQSNLLKVLALSPEIPPGCRNDLSAGLNLPLPEWAKTIDDLRGRQISRQTLQSETGQGIYKVEIQVDPAESARSVRKKNVSDFHLSDTQAMSGTLYLDEKNGNLLSFDGEVTGFYMKEYYKQGEKTIPVEIKMHIDFEHERHFTEPSVLRFVLKYKNKETRIVAFKVDDNTLIDGTPLYRSDGFLAENNMMRRCRINDENPSWPKDIILRSEEEEIIAKETMGTRNGK